VTAAAASAFGAKARHDAKARNARLSSMGKSPQS
jgi:hypothetical protein